MLVNLNSFCVSTSRFRHIEPVVCSSVMCRVLVRKKVYAGAVRRTGLMTSSFFVGGLGLMFLCDSNNKLSGDIPSSVWF